MATEEARSVSRERVARVAKNILTAFESGELPKALANLFIHRPIEIASRHWTWTNRVIALQKGHVYAAGFRQWQAVGRQVRRGECAFHILAPRIVVAREDDEARGVHAGEEQRAGFFPVPVFGYFQTEGAPLAGAEDSPEFLCRLPLVEVARAWGLTVTLYSFEDAPDRLGYFTPGRGIGLGVENLATWTHELVHAADHRRGARFTGSDLDAEVVAEFGGAILLESLGYHAESDRGGAYAYLDRLCTEKRQNVLQAASELLERTCAAVALLLTEAERQARPAAAATAESLLLHAP